MKSVSFSGRNLRLAHVLGLAVLQCCVIAQTDFEALDAEFKRHIDNGCPDSALFVAKMMSAKSLEELGDTSLWYATSIGNTGQAFYENNSHDSAFYYYEKAEEPYSLYHPETLGYVKNCANLGILYYNFEKFNYSKILFTKALNITRNSFHKDSVLVANGLVNLGGVNVTLGNYPEAEYQLLLALDIKSRLIGEFNLEVATIMHNLGTLYVYLADYTEAEQFLMKSLGIQREILGEDNIELSNTLNSLGWVNEELGNFAEAERLYARELDIIESNLGEEHLSFASSLNSLGNLYNDLGDFNKAEEFYSKSLEITTMLLDEDCASVANLFHNLGNINSDLGKFKKAKDLFSKSLKLEMKNFGEESLGVANTLNSLGCVHFELGNYFEAENLFQRSLMITVNLMGEDFLGTHLMLNNLGNVKAALRNFPEAEQLFLKALDIQKKHLGDLHPNFLQTKTQFAALQFDKEDFVLAHELMKEVFTTNRKLVTDNFAWMSESLKEAYWKEQGEFFTELTYYASEAPASQGPFQELAYDGALFRKSRLLETAMDEEDYEENRNQLRAAHKEAWRKLSKMRAEGGYDSYEHSALESQVDSLDRALQLSLPEYAAMKRNLTINWKQVQRGLEDHEVAIEFVRFFHDGDSVHKYSALLIDSDCPAPIHVPLCLESDLTALIDSQPLAESLDDLHSLVWAPLQPELEGKQVVYYAADGILNQVPFHALIASGRDEPVTYLLDRFEIHKLTSTRFLALDLKSQAQEPPASSIAMLGGMDYFYLPGGEEDPEKNLQAAKERSSTSMGAPLRYLKGTLSELKKSTKTLKGSDFFVTSTTGKDAIEEAIYELESDGTPGILHIATHGYAFPEMDYSDTTISENSLRYVYRHSPYPMVRSGLIMTSGNWKWMGNDTLSILGHEDGILTAMEVANLPLDDCKLVVLSACETALGHIDEQEGTLGLVRGFKLAGVDQILATLWRVDDRTTAEFMTTFYDDLSASNNTLKAFQTTQQQMRETYPLEPYHWAGFVLIR